MHVTNAFPMWSAFNESVERENAFIFNRSVRSYQSTILGGGTFSITCPITGDSLTPTYSVVYRSNVVGYRFESAEPFWVVCTRIDRGYPLAVIFFPSRSQVFQIAGKIQGMEPPAPLFVACEEIQSTWLSEVGSDNTIPATIGHRGPILVVGHQNFAHHLWNELSALECWAADSPPLAVSNLQILLMMEPLGPIETIIPALQAATFIRNTAPITIVSERMAVRIGSTFVTSSIRQRIIALSSSTPRTKLIEDKLKDASPIFWITARMGLRTCVNQAEFLSVVLQRISAKWPNSATIFDGFSYPEDFQSKLYHRLHVKYSQREKDTSKYIDDVISQSPIPSTAIAINASGLSLMETIYLAGKAVYYISHAGSLQHKIAWIHNTPGYIHSCKAGITKSAGISYAGQIEGGIVPHLAPLDLVRDVIPEGINVATRNYNYTLDIDAVVQDILMRAAEIV